MIRNKKAMLFCSQIILTGALITGAPCLASGAEIEMAEEDGTSGSVFGSSATTADSEEVDHSGEGQIHKPSSLEVPDFTSDPDFVDDSTDNTYGYYTIMGCTTVDAEDMVVQYEAQNVEYPSGILTEGGAPDIDTFCTIVIEEADAEGVRGEVVFEQAMLETGWLQFGGDASAGQFNFSGLGTTGGGVAGNSFPDVRTGIRAQVQHLKAYASSEELNQACVDNRFQYVSRESAPYVEWLGIQENPYGGGWAAGRSYGYKLRSLLAELKGGVYLAGEYGDGGEVVVVANGTARKGVRFCPRPGFVGGWI